jgi:hypothetical protein
MAADTGFDKFVSTLIPNLGAITDDAKADWRPEIHDDRLRKSLFANDHIADDLRQNLLGFHCGPFSDAEHDADATRLFQFLTSQEIDLVERRCGLVHHVHQIADLIATGQLNPAVSGWPIEDLRFALGLRGEIKHHPPKADDLQASVRRSGAACLSAWLNALPEPITRLLAILDAPLGASFRLANRTSGIASVCQLCLSRMEAV